MLAVDEFIVGVMQDTNVMGDVLGSAIVFYTSEGRILPLQGTEARSRVRFIILCTHDASPHAVTGLLTLTLSTDGWKSFAPPFWVIVHAFDFNDFRSPKMGKHSFS